MSLYKPNPEEISTFATVEDFDGIEGTPWEKLAYKLPKGATVPQMLEAAHLNWKVQHLQEGRRTMQRRIWTV